jgi:hypothetical protein
MNRIASEVLLRIMTLAMILAIPFAASNQDSVRAHFKHHGQASCADNATNCKAPVKYLGERKGCACFVCEYGTKNQKIRCSGNESEKNKFRALLPKTKK